MQPNFNPFPGEDTQRPQYANYLETKDTLSLHRAREDLLLCSQGILYIALLTNRTTGGVTASFGMLGDIIIAEPRALIGFAGPRVIEYTIKQRLPKGFQTSEFLLEHGILDMIVQRKDLKQTISKILSFLNN